MNTPEKVTPSLYGHAHAYQKPTSQTPKGSTHNQGRALVDGIGTTAYTYDQVRQILSEGGLWPDDTVNFTYQNRLRMRLSLAHPNGSPWTEDYDDARRLIGVESSAGQFDYTYDAFGNLISQWYNGSGPTPNDYLYCGLQFDTVSGTYNNRARRMFSPLGRFTSMDQTDGNNEDPLSLHKYLYAEDDSVNLSDEELQEFADAIKVIRSGTIGEYNAGVAEEILEVGAEGLEGEEIYELIDIAYGIDGVAMTPD
ncbi:MAG TPA: RHS repeat-associated core domain-containing protein [Candidatus Sulfotelmatobacter sp.]|nr:RHS repeat-associated core domain-containing protein [Candidatus Sulfotelmatobacter sp.]